MRRLKVWGGIKWVLMRVSKNKKDVEGGLVIAFFFFFAQAAMASCQSQEQEVETQ